MDEEPERIDPYPSAQTLLPGPKTVPGRRIT
jgi:hypothetical protein